eukprot:180255-Chlamydomonas_euryale.AAC.1
MRALQACSHSGSAPSTAIYICLADSAALKPTFPSIPPPPLPPRVLQGSSTRATCLCWTRRCTPSTCVCPTRRSSSLAGSTGGRCTRRCPRPRAVSRAWRACPANTSFACMQVVPARQRRPGGTRDLRLRGCCRCACAGLGGACGGCGGVEGEGDGEARAMRGYMAAADARAQRGEGRVRVWGVECGGRK